jgi:hypothetical protein
MPSNAKTIHKKDVVEQRVKNVQNLAIDLQLCAKYEQLMAQRGMLGWCGVFE